MVRKIRIYRESRPTPLLEPKRDFPPLSNLRLDLLEDKAKLKKSLPLIPLNSKSNGPRLDLYPIMLDTGKFLLAKPEEQKELPSDKNPSTPSLPDQETPLNQIIPPQLENNPPPINLSPEDQALFDALGDISNEKEVSPSVSLPSKEAEVDFISPALSETDEPEEKEREEEKEEEDPYAGLTPEEREIKEREEYTWRFRILRKQYKKNINLPTFTEFTPLETIKNQYKQIIREMALDDNVDTYRTYLFGSWLAIEFVCTQWVGIDLSGFTKYQALMLHKYDKLLIELGEKSRGAWGANLPVEVRLIGLVLFQAAVFYLIKVVAGKFGCSVADLFSIFMGQPPSSPDASPNSGGGGFGSMLGDLMSSFTGEGNPTPPLSPKDSTSPPPTKMRGPSISAKDIRSRRTQKE